MDIDQLTYKIQQKMEAVSIALMKHEQKNYCLAKVHPYNWRFISYKYQNKDNNFIIVPSPAFERLIINREFLKIVDKFSQYFGTGSDWDIVKALKIYDKDRLLHDYSDQEYFDYIRGETMAYVFKIFDDDSISDRILRLDLCRNINRDNIFQGGIFHVFKHFTPIGFETISSHSLEFEVESFSQIYQYIILNFFSDDFVKEKGNCYKGKSILPDGHTLRGIYFKEEDVPVAFINSMRVDS